MSEILKDGTVVLDTPEDIGFARLLALKGAVRLEVMGSRRRGPKTACSAVREMFGMPKNCPKEEVLARLTEEIDKLQAKRKS